MKYSEEDIKQKIVMPYLEAIGFGRDELRFEKSFRIQLPRRSAQIDTAADTAASRARLDILVTRNGVNLFIVEVKTDAHELTEADRDQAITYCRLVHPVAPVAIVTNGRDAKMYNAIDRAEVNWKKENILSFDPKADLHAIYEEALLNFVSYSEENVRLFCESQVKTALKPLLGSRAEPHKKYIPELYVASQSLGEDIRQFLQNEDKPVFAVIGDPGLGKTCALCGLAEAYLKTHPVLFFRARNITKDLAAYIADDFSWEFSAQSNAAGLFKRLSSIFKGKQILLVLDAVDEWENPQKVELLGEIARQLVAKNIKLILSCRTEQWPKFLRVSGTPSDLSQYVMVSNDKTPAHRLSPFTDPEFIQLLSNYRAFYGFAGSIEAEVIKQCRSSPFLLRIVFEVAHRSKRARLTLSTKEVYDEYHEVVLERLHSADRDIARRTIQALAQVQLQKNEDTSLESEIRKALQLRINEDIPQSLFDAGILERNYKGEDASIGFYFRKFRDYLIAFKVEKWDRQETAVFRKAWQEKLWLGVQLQALVLFYQLVDEEKKAAIDGPHRELASKYLATYEFILSHHFRELRVRFLPHTEGRIGLVGVLDLSARKIVAFGYIPIEQDDHHPVKFVPTLGHIWGKDESDLPFLHRVRLLRSCNWSDGNNAINIERSVLDRDIIEQLTELVRGGFLNETHCYYLPLEIAIGLVTAMQKHRLGIMDAHRLSQYLPIPIDKIEFGLRYGRAWRQLHHQARMRKAQVQHFRDGSGVYSNLLTQEDLKTLDQEAEAVAASNKMLDTVVRDVAAEQAERFLEDALVALRRKVTAIEQPILPDWDNTTGSIRYVWDYWKPETLAKWISRLYEYFLSDYKALIETNFPTLKEHFELYSKMPIRCFLVFDLRRAPFGIEIFYCPERQGGINEVTVCEWTDLAYDPTTDQLSWREKQYKPITHIFTSLDSIMCSSSYYPLFSLPSESVILRHKVYAHIARELPTALHGLRSSVLGQR